MREQLRALGGPGRVVLSAPEGAAVAALHIDRPRARGALSGKMLAELDDALEALEGFGGAAVIVHGGRSFCSGADLKQVRSSALGAELGAFGTALLDRLRALPLVSVAAVEGHAAGGGAELALACDLRVLSTAARLHFVHARLGLSPGWGSAGRLVAALGRREALKILLSARPIGAQRALDLGLADRLCPPGGALAAARDLLEQLLACEPEVARRIKAAVAAAEDLPPERARAIEGEAFRALWGGPAHRAALRALKQGR